MARLLEEVRVAVMSLALSILVVIALAPFAVALMLMWLWLVQQLLDEARGVMTSRRRGARRWRR